MTENTVKFCKICLHTKKDRLVKLSFQHKIFKYILCDNSLPVYLCHWCKRAVRVVEELIKTSNQSKQLLRYYKKISIIPKKPKPHNLTKHCNFTLDITTRKSVDTNVIHYYHKDSRIEEIQEVCQSLLQEEVHEDVQESDREEYMEVVEVEKRDIDRYDELKFDVKYLTNKEQLEEINLKKVSPMYRNMKFQCDECGKGYLTRDIFDQHRLKHLESAGANKCPICKLHFKSAEVLSHHRLSHKRRFCCRVCNATFGRWTHCVEHRHKCGAVAISAACHCCPKVFNNQISLERHVKFVHKKEKKYACEQCDKRFSTKQKLTIHSRTHSGIKPFSCDICSRSFGTNTNLRTHMMVHEHSKDYYCVECNSFYKSEKSLKRHFLVSPKHASEDSMEFKCNLCPKLFKTESLLNSHVHLRHMTVYKCQICDKTFSTNTNLNKHVRCIHSISC